MAKAKPEGGDKKPSQKAMVQDALDHLGKESKPAEMQAHIKSKFNVELAPNIISNYKSQIKRESRAGGVSRPRRGAVGGSLQVEDFEIVRKLVNRLGVEQVKKLVEVVS